MNGAQRKRSKQELERDELGDELNALKIDGFGYSAAIAAGPRAKRTSTASTQSATATDGALPNASTGFDFRAICTYRDRDTIGDEMHSSKLTDVAADLWDRIESAQNIWEKSWGAEWREELMRHCARVPDKYVCVTRLLLRKRTNWGSGREPGMFACVDCVRAGLPCFTHVWQDASSEIQLLPLHEKERGGPVIKGEEVMWWIKRGVGMPESDGEM